ncbi:Na(+)/H(+) antiporter subunit F1 [Fictibacillus enclensis]|jgi:multicomponent Na+:H+ antiporter subunit F|uniref:Cation:proton antiporter n=1 Tax=Fictibacillus enclensis TaxID=1017270 RepID=A0A0V8JFX0_9BACL|nr:MULTISPECIES: Na(+)/H(+) antiporter subunit F1 [Fictibacillus]KSU85841.1 cation:proton antiporter [Fictibacillus enclensis]MDM5199800.1 Na(+)/H(+) antiporter subunit F1 [Fictibacillus enclensis]MDM5339039.1 Na(+)/H(+) antiporter subunit F1 [Fictibacillus enclensis]RXY98442.1 Na(+)/H(+) antiporter subunit F1 [Fictibacillus sp. S7]WHY70522.1 Na(+)/H(+) antiporter subunit F1 [Fictibacillus enclensis]
MSSWFENVVTVCLIVNCLSVLLLVYRVVWGPSSADRAVAIDTIGVNLIAITALVSIRLNTIDLHDVILLIGILTFIATVAIAKFLDRGVLIDRDRN